MFEILLTFVPAVEFEHKYIATCILPMELMNSRCSETMELGGGMFSNSAALSSNCLSSTLPYSMQPAGTRPHFPRDVTNFVVAIHILGEMVTWSPDQEDFDGGGQSA